jgi:DNA-binding response OmpR family regulator
LSEGYEVIDTVDPEQALGLALEHKPDAILLDLMMPKFSGFELCQSFCSLSYTRLRFRSLLSRERQHGCGPKYREDQ